MAQITLNEGLAWLKTLKKRHEELITLRDGNAHRERRFYGAAADKEIVKEPVYDVKALDKSVTRVARGMKLHAHAELWGSRGGVRSLVGLRPMKRTWITPTVLATDPRESLLVGCRLCGGAISAEAPWFRRVLSHPVADPRFPLQVTAGRRAFECGHTACGGRRRTPWPVSFTDLMSITLNIKPRCSTLYDEAAPLTCRWSDSQPGTT